MRAFSARPYRILSMVFWRPPHTSRFE